MPYRKRPPSERFKRRVEEGGEDECWPWTGHRDRDGYGYFTFSKEPRKVLKAHRYAFFLAFDVWPEVCRHHCDNPACCNPRHLADGSHADNVSDMVSRGRQRGAPRGSAHPNARIGLDMAREIRAWHAEGETLMAIAQVFGVSYGSVSNIVNGRVWPEE